MCNALNHPPGCACGFGPPYPGKVTFGKGDSWSDVSLWDAATFERGLRQSGMNNTDVQNIMNSYHSMVPPIGKQAFDELPAPKKSVLLNQIKKLFGTREEERILESKTEKKEIPLFLLHSPKCPRSKASYEETQRKSKVRGWHITIPGIGKGSNHTVIVEYTSEFESKDGECTTIFVLIPFYVSKMGVYKNDDHVRDYLKIEVQRNKAERTLRKVSKDCPKDRCNCLESALQSGEQLGFFPLSKEHPGKIAKYSESWESDKISKYTFKLAAFGMEVGAEANIECQQKISLKYELPGGQDYKLFSTPNVNGIVWQIEQPV